MRVLLAAFDGERVVLWQARQDDDARVVRFAASLPSLLGDGAADTDVVRSVSVRRAAFEEVLRQAVHCEYAPAIYSSRESWRLATRFAQASVSWHPHATDPGREVPHFSVRGRALERLLDGAAVAEWGSRAQAGAQPDPAARPYPLAEAQLRYLAGEGALGSEPAAGGS